MPEPRPAAQIRPTADPSPAKLEFAHTLRAVAAFSVFIAHLGMGFWLNPHGVAAFLRLPMPEEIPAPPVAARLLAWLWQLVPGVTDRVALPGFGVALFFLISGFVIPFAFAKQSRLGFLAARAIRLWPTYAAGLTVTVIALWLGSLVSGTPFPHTAKQVAANYALGTRDLLGVPSIDGVVWTLEIELKFYLLCALLAPLLAAGRARVFLVAPCLGAITMLAAQFGTPLGDEHWRLRGLAWVASVDAQLMILMFVGVAFHYLYRGWLGPVRGTGLILCLFTQTSLVGYAGFLAQEQTAHVWNQAAALAVFALAYRFRDRFRGRGSLAWVADVSYPLYVVHGVAGYVLMAALLRAGVPADLTFAAGLAAPLALAWLLHRFVERPTHEWARRAARRLSPIAAGRSPGDSPQVEPAIPPSARAA